ncbi:MAG: DUF2461 domain-containing protein [Bacteroidota bacterium]
MHADYPPFPGFREEAFTFLRQLKSNNDRDWFKPRKATYEDEILWPLRCLIADASRQAAERGLPLSGDPKKSHFRIYRDTRFSKNKDPYKTHASAVLSRSGSKKEPGGAYVHIEPGHTFIATGFWRPPTPVVRVWRTHMGQDPTGFLEMAKAMDDAGIELEFGIRPGESLKRIPRGFEEHKDTALDPYLRAKSLIAMRYLPDEAAQTPAFTDAVVQHMEETLPLLRFGWTAQEEAPAS